MTSGLQVILEQGESLAANLTSIAALLTTLAAASSCLTTSSAGIRTIVFPAGPGSGLFSYWYRSCFSVSGRTTAVPKRSGRMSRLVSSRVIETGSFGDSCFSGDGPVLERADVYIRNGVIVDVIEEGGTATENRARFMSSKARARHCCPD